jgi:4-hydroxythreonine-4-phosphate dehydrogenase
MPLTILDNENKNSKYSDSTPSDSKSTLICSHCGGHGKRQEKGDGRRETGEGEFPIICHLPRLPVSCLLPLTPLCFRGQPEYLPKTDNEGGSFLTDIEQPIGITMGCPVGIGPEIILKFFQTHAIETKTTKKSFSVIVIGSWRVLEQTSRKLGIPAHICPWNPGDTVIPGTIPVISAGDDRLRGLKPGMANKETALAMISWIEQAVRLIEDGFISAMVTCPISKTGLRLAGSPWPGHTEMLASLTKTDRYRMMMAGSRLRVVLTTIHEPLARVSSLLSRENVSDCIDMTIHTLIHDFGLKTPRVAVAGLNPHAGEDSMFGTEEEYIIRPAVEEFSGSEALVSGPWPPDTVYHRAAGGDFDAVVAAYHDQGLIPFKLLHFKDGVNVTIGLPIIRTSVDHGTAYDIAGRNMADCASLTAAVNMAASFAVNRGKL